MKSNQILSYTHDRVIQRYNNCFPKAKLKGEAAFSELMKFIYLCTQHAEDIKKNPHNPQLRFVCAIHTEMLEIDEIWHLFLVFTRDYAAFCNEYLNGHFFHHEPTDVSKPINIENYETELRYYLTYIEQKLGKETLALWFNA